MKIGVCELSCAPFTMKNGEVYVKKMYTYEEAVEYLLNIPKFTKKNTMEDTKAFLKELNLPLENKKIIHVAGTNGKGSVCFYLNNLLNGAKKTTGLFTSPHLVDIRERFRINGKMVTKDAFLEAFMVVYEKVMSKYEDPLDGYHPTFFEFLFFMAMLLFRGEEIEYIILETGLGGMLDATNALETKKLTLITSIGLDHTEYLGNTIEEIAVQKAGILRKDTGALYFGGANEAAGVIGECIRKVGAIGHCVDKNLWKDVKFRDKNIDFSYKSRYYDYIAITMSGIATYQIENVSMALLALELLLNEEEMPNADTIREIMKVTVWPGRMEEVFPDVFLDGAHNENGICAFLDSVAKVNAKKKTLLFAVVSDKDYDSIIGHIVKSELFDEIVITGLDNSRALSVQEILQKFYECGRKEVIVIDDVEQAFETLCMGKNEGEQIYVAGSLYLVGKIKEIIGRNQND